MNVERADPRDRLEYRSETNTYRVTYSHHTDPPSQTVVETVATIGDRDFHELEPLYEVIDPSALDALFQPTRRGGHRGDGEVSFTYHDHEVTVHSDGVIEIQPLAQSE